MSTTTSAAPATTEAAPPAMRRLALRDLAAVLPGIVAFGIVIGIMVVTTRTSAVAGLLGAAAVYGGSAQLTTITVLQLGAGLLAAALAGVVVNARLLLYSAALAPWFRDQPRWFRMLGPHFVIDQTYLSAVARPQLRGADFRRYWGWLGLSLLACWLSAVATGIVAAPLLPDLPHLVLVGTAIFLAMLVPRLVDRASLTAAAGGGGTAWVVSVIAPDVAILAGAVVGVGAASVLGNRRRPEIAP